MSEYVESSREVLQNGIFYGVPHTSSTFNTTKGTIE